MLDLKVFILELEAVVYTRDSRAITINEITTLDHKVFDDPMKLAAFISLWHAINFILSIAELSEIFGCFGGNISE